jgi:hypothetical protein
VWGYSIYELEVYGTSGCSVPAQPGAISGNTSVAFGSNQTYSVAAVSGATSYTWSLPSGWSGSSTSTSISATAGSAGGTISVTANNSCGASAARTLAVSVSGGGFTLRVEAENYQYMAGVTKVACSEGGQNISSFDATDWMSYTIAIPTAGTYIASFRVSATTTGKSIRFEKDAGTTLLATIPASNTGGAQIWTTVSQTVTLPAGSYSVGLATATGGVNINWFELSSAAGRTVAMNENQDTRIVVFPTIVEHTLYVKTTSEFKNSEVSIVDEVGREFAFKKIDENTYDVSTLPSGLYILRLTNGYRLSTTKFIKK